MILRHKKSGKRFNIDTNNISEFVSIILIMIVIFCVVFYIGSNPDLFLTTARVIK